MGAIVVDAERCTHCGACVLACSEHVFQQREKGAPPTLEHLPICIACGHCVMACPADAIRHEAFPEGTVHAIDTERLPSAAQTLELMRRRRSLRSFQDKPVSREDIEQVLEAARLAPSAHNFQTTEYVVVQDPALLQRISEMTVAVFEKMARQLRNPAIRALFGLRISREEIRSLLGLLTDFDLLVEAARRGEDPVLHKAPCLIVAHAERSVNFPEANAILALHNATLQATAMGLGGYLVGYVVGACRQDAGMRRLLGVPKGHAVRGALTLGHPKQTFARWVERRPLKIGWM